MKKNENLVCLHGLSKDAQRMSRIAAAAELQGYEVCNPSYPSTEFPVEALATQVYEQIEASGFLASNKPLHFVVHSLGGLITRILIQRGLLPNLGRVVMLGTPNHGTEVADLLSAYAWYRRAYGPAGVELCTGSKGIAAQLPAADYDLGIIAGDRTVDPWFSWFVLPGADDGKVSVESTKLEGMRDHQVMHVTHPYMPFNRKVIQQALHYLQHGSF